LVTQAANGAMSLLTTPITLRERQRRIDILSLILCTD
jgi:hypothetical protein